MDGTEHVAAARSSMGLAATKPAAAKGRRRLEICMVVRVKGQADARDTKIRK